LRAGTSRQKQNRILLEGEEMEVRNFATMTLGREPKGGFGFKKQNRIA